VFADAIANDVEERMAVRAATRIFMIIDISTERKLWLSRLVDESVLLLLVRVVGVAVGISVSL
jgi:hypothetical protein